MTSPADEIIARDIRFGIEAQADRAWFGGDLMMSVVVDALAVMLPEGERFFIRSLKHYAPDIDDAEVQAEIRGYAVQEAFHTREHEAYNAALGALGYDVAGMEARLNRMLGREIGPVLRLMSTCAIEQVTYSLARFILKRPELMDAAAPAYRRLWRWHALEELEHSAVALRVLRAAPTGLAPWKRYLLRVAVLNAVFAQMIWLAIGNMHVMLRATGVRTGLRTRLRLAWLLFGRPGFLRGLVGPWFAYMRPGYPGGGGAADAGLVAEGRRLLRDDPPAVPA
ncbi:metal-dependent hydrolase [Roseomonas sp. HF4]|uniref:metal-dependent hydrolase n=1 Tax=Roseomonas sp. HF4 TaxID=2562313 RepID=UPI0010C0BD12|nr:metal-dependent hydrolase [Roseomonas sp. HF4]